MAKQPPQEHRTSLPPKHFLEKLSEATVSYDEMFNPTQPVTSYRNLLKVFMARIKGNEARLVPIGMYPIQGSLVIATFGYLSCQVEPEGDGSLIRSAYSLGGYRFIIAGFILFGIVMLLAIGILPKFAQGVEGFWLLSVGATSFALFSFGYPLWILRAAKTQEKLSREFLDDFVDQHA